MDEDTRDRVRMLLRGPLAWPLPAVLVHALVLLASHRVWTDVTVTNSRSGRGGEIVVAHKHALLLAVCAVAFWATFALRDGFYVSAARGMRPPTATEVGCAYALVRVALLLVMYGSAFVLVRDYVF